MELLSIKGVFIIEVLLALALLSISQFCLTLKIMSLEWLKRKI